ncbi:glycosyltransferase family 8 protein [Patellaria atrata CBS 101060]|uniref:Glycosyltransferase family 8 protein n=1 Tax=Patellaria atrata CBS 101060 TaxID=1346257 RepID=A0A9P4SHS6_9PEZI|nr:glycosyltransferase family 8 protein [Patellaria atrata CBS 101060]
MTVFSSYRAVFICVSLFLASAIISYNVHSPHGKVSWPEGSTPLTSKKPSLAFATFLAGKPGDETSTTPDDEDGYYLGARVLAYKLLHSPTTRSRRDIPFLVLVTEDVAQRKRDRLTKDGATVITIEKITSEFVHTEIERWKDVLSKLRLFDMTQYTKICFIDADHLVVKRLEGVFEDDATMVMATQNITSQTKDDEAPLPATFMFASKTDAGGYSHPYPPEPGDYLNAGFFVFQPSKELFNYYLSVININGRFDPGFPEQNLFNYAHRRDGNMPWQQLLYSWNMNWPTENDLRGGAASFHAKYWDGDPTHDPVLKEIWQQQRWEMQGYYMGAEEAREE